MPVTSGIQQGWGRQIPQHMIKILCSTWGARAIFQRQTVDLLHDRQSMSTSIVEDEAARDRLTRWVNKTGLPYIRKAAKGLYSDENRTIALTEDSFHIEANPQSSYGYLYIRAWQLSVDLDTKTHEAVIADPDQISSGLERYGDGLAYASAQGN